MEKDLHQFEELLKGVLAIDNGVRKQAEAILQRSRESNAPDTLITLLVALMRRSQAPEVRQLCAILTRQELNKDVWGKLSPGVKDNLKANLLELLSNENERAIRKQVNDLVGVLAAKILPLGEWNALLPALFTLVQSPNPAHRESVFLVFEVVIEHNLDSVRGSSQQLQQALTAGLREKRQTNVQLSALRATAALLLALEPRERAAMAEVIKFMFQVVGDAYETKNDDAIRESIQTLVTVVRGEVGYLRTVVKPVVGAMLKICADKTLEGGTRRMSLELLLALAEAGKGMMRKDHEYCVAVVHTAFQFMLEVDADLNAWAQSQKETDLGDEEQFQMGIEGVDRLATFLGGKIFLAIGMPLLKQYLGSQAWQNRHAGLMALSPIADRCKKLLTKQLDTMVGLVLPFIKGDSCVRVQWAAINSMAALTTLYAPTVQEKYHREILSAYVANMNLTNHPRIVAHAALALVDFCNGLHQAAEEEEEEEEHTTHDGMPKPNPLVSQYLKDLLGALLPLLQSNHIKLQEAALSAVSALSLVASINFTPYYDSFMPGVKAILVNSQGKDRRELKGKAIECIAVMGRAVGAAKFRADCKPIMETLVQTLKTGVASDDPVYNYTVQACARICQAIGQEFVPYLDFVIPGLLKSAAISDAFEISETGVKSEKEGMDGYESVTLSIRALGDRRVTVNTSLLEEKATACNMLYQYAKELKDGFFPFVEATATVLIPLMPFPFNETVRIAAVDAMPALLGAVRTTQDKKGGGDTLLRRLWESIFEPMMKAMQQEVHLEYLNGILDSLSECLAVLSFPLPQQHLTVLNEFVGELIKESHIRREKREEVRKGEDFDEEEGIALAEENEEEDVFLMSAYTVVAKIAKLNGESYADQFNTIQFNLWFPLLDPKRSNGQRLPALCVFDDVIQYCGPKTAGYAKSLLPIILADDTMLNEDEDIRQAAAFGTGMCAERLGSAFAPSIQQAASQLLKLITHPDSRKDNNGEATDNAISALGRICKITGKENVNIQGQPLLSLWLSVLPAKDDEEEAQIAHSFLCDFVEAGYPHLLGPNNSNIPKVVAVFGAVAGTDLINPQTSKRMLAIMMKLKQSLGQQFTQLLASLPQDHQAALARLS